jgi:hypothetical protein
VQPLEKTNASTALVVLQPVFFVIVFTLTHTAIAFVFCEKQKAKLQTLSYTPKNYAKKKRSEANLHNVVL